MQQRMATIRDLQRALELAHYASRNRGAVHVVVLGGTVTVGHLQLDLRLLGAYGMRTVVVGHWQGGATRDLVSLARRQGFPLELLDGDDEPAYVLTAVSRALAAGQVPVVLLPDGASGRRRKTSFEVGRWVAAALKARRVLFVTSDAPRLLDGDNRPHLTPAEAMERAQDATERDADAAAGWQFVLDVLGSGVPGVVVLEGRPGVVFEELFTHQGAGVLVGGELFEDVRRATLADAADISLLLRAEMERGVVRPVSEDELLATVDQHLVYAIDGVVIGTARLAPYGSWAELSRFATLPRHRGRGRARRLGNALIEWGRSLGYTDLFALSIDERMWRFFESLDFVAIERDVLPAAWQRAYDFTRPSRAFHRSLRLDDAAPG
jgi:N-acetylglutamate synthase-like GNAT family acetyltransferase